MVTLIIFECIVQLFALNIGKVDSINESCVLYWVASN